MNYLQELKLRIDQHTEFSWQRQLELKRGEFLKLAGTTDTNFYFITQGCLRAFLENEQGEQTIRFGYTGNFFGALDSFISEQPSPLAMQAMRKSTLLSIPRSVFLDFIEANNVEQQQTSSFATLSNQQIWSELKNSFILGLMEREMDLLTASPAERYQRVFQRSPHLFQLVPAKYIANYLRMTPETLSRLRKE